jgi:alkyl hydroperoxide reductase subunit AhpC
MPHGLTETRPIRVGDAAPDFTADTTEGSLSLYEYAGKGWVIFFSHSKDVAPVCTAEEFKRRGAKLLGLSVDAGQARETMEAKAGFPVAEDPDGAIAGLYGMIHPNESVRTVFFIDPGKKVRAMLAYPAPAGRDLDELLRVLDALRLG